MRLPPLLASAFVLVVLTITPSSAQVPFDIPVNTLGFEQRQTITKPDALFGGTAVTDGRLILARGDGGVFHTFIRTSSGFVETHPLYEPSPLAGRSLAIHNGRAIVGFEYGAGVFHFTDAGWVLEKYVVRSDPVFGLDVDITDEYAIVASNATAVIVRREGTTWHDEFEFTEPADVVNGGSRVAISGTRATTHFDSGVGRGGFGPIRVWERGSAGWFQAAVFNSGILPGDMDFDGTLFVEAPDLENLLGAVRILDLLDPNPAVVRSGLGPFPGKLTVDRNRIAVSKRSFGANPGGAFVLDSSGATLFNVLVTEFETDPDSGRIARRVGQSALSGNILVVPTQSFLDRPGALTIFEIPGQSGGSPSPSGTRTPPTPQIVDSNLDVWTLGSTLETLRNGTHVGGLGTELLWHQNVLYVFGLDSQWWRWTGTGWTPHGTNDPAGSGSGLTPSPSGTRSPPAAQIVDSNLDVWTLGENLETLRNGVHVTGFGTEYLWHQNTLYVLAFDGTWWRWTGGGWTPHGPTDPSSSRSGVTPSPSGTRSPPASSITDNDGAVWTIGPGLQTLRNGVHPGGFGTEYLWYQSTLYVLGVDSNWWMWTGSGWSFFGPNEPS